MDYYKEYPNVQEEKTIYNAELSGFGLSLQGGSHIKRNIPCQDYSKMEYLDEFKILVAAISDGVGSCKASHWGSYVAVETVIDFFKINIKEKFKESTSILTEENKQIIRELFINAFHQAIVQVRELDGDDYEFQSTLTVALYDGTHLFYGHVGDDGIVVQTQDGEVKMITDRIKGEDANSVYPLQSGEKYWSFGYVDKPVAAFAMATDGVLDAFVAKHIDTFGFNYFNGICYSLIEEGIYKLGESGSENVDNVLSKYKEYFQSESFRNIVDDDVTLMLIVSRELLNDSKRPWFSKNLWDTIQHESNLHRRSRLWKTKNNTSEIGIFEESYEHKVEPEPQKQDETVESNCTEMVSEKTIEEKVVETVTEPIEDKQENQQRKKRRPLIIAALLVISLCIGFFVGKYSGDTVKASEYQKLQTENTNLSKEIKENKKTIEKLQKDLKNSAVQVQVSNQSEDTFKVENSDNDSKNN